MEFSIKAKNRSVVLLGVGGTGLIAEFPICSENTCGITHKILAEKHFRLHLDVKGKRWLIFSVFTD